MWPPVLVPLHWSCGTLTLSISLSLTHTHTKSLYIHLFSLLFFFSSSRLDNPTASYLSARLCSYHPQPPHLPSISHSPHPHTCTYIPPPTHTHTHLNATPPHPLLFCWWAKAPLHGHITPMLHPDNYTVKPVVLCVCPCVCEPSFQGVCNILHFTGDAVNVKPE